MYRDAKEELKRLEEALLQEDDQSEDAENPWDIAIDEAVFDVPDLPQKDNRGKIIFGLTMAVVAMTAIIVALLVYIFVFHGEAFL